ncbi:MAG: DEAD/DEAH box helicase [Candidatus Hodarchaeales archaeon]
MQSISSFEYEGFHPILKNWFRSTYPNGPTETQISAWNHISQGENTLIVAPTGSGKTFAAFLAIINELLYLDSDLPYIYCLYISPLKALGNDIRKNLIKPLDEMKRIAENSGIDLSNIQVKIRTGDTLPKEREKIRRKPPQILITTPESAFLLLTSLKQRKNLTRLKYVIIDEIHALANNKRGLHLSATIERLERLVIQKTHRSFTRIALSATVNPIELIQNFLGGISDQTNEFRPVTLIKEEFHKNVQIEVPLFLSNYFGTHKDEIWKKIIEKLIEIISLYKPTLIFTNSRKLTEKIVFELNEQLSENSLIVLGHHGSLSREKRLDTENKLKNGEIDAVIATNTLELGIDIGAIERVVQLESPKSFSASMQRIGRSGHTLTGISRGIFLSTTLEEYIENLVIAKNISKNKSEKIIILENSCDIIIQHLVSYAMEGGNLTDFYSIIRSAYPFRNLEFEKLISIAELLSRRNIANLPETIFRWKPRLFFDPISNYIGDGSSIIWQNSGTIPETGQYEVLLIEEDNETFRVGNLDEEFVFYLKTNDIIHLGGGISTYEVLSIDKGKVYVKSSENKLPTLPYWKGPKLSRSYEVGKAIGEFKDEISKYIRNNELFDLLKNKYKLNDKETKFLSDFFIKQYNRYHFVSGFKNILIESFIDEENRYNIIITSPFGYSTNNTWLWTIIKTLENNHEGITVDFVIQGIVSDDMINIQIRSSTEDKRDFSIFNPRNILLAIDKDKINLLLKSYISTTKYFGTFFRINCVRSLLILRQLGARKIPIKVQRFISEKILNGLINPETFLIYQETINEILHSNENLNVQQLQEIYQLIENKEVNLIFKESTDPNLSLYSLYTSGSMTEIPQNTLEYRAKNIQIPQYLIDTLQELEEQSPLFDNTIITKLELEWQFLSQETKVRSIRGLQELFLQIGDLFWSNDKALSIEERIDIEFTETAKEIITSWLEKGILLEISIPESENHNPDKRYIPVEHYVDYEEAYEQEILINTTIKSKIEDRYHYFLDDPFQARKNIIKRFIDKIGPITIDDIKKRYKFSNKNIFAILQDLVALKELVKGNFVENKPYPQYLSYKNFKNIKEASNRYYLRNTEPVVPEKYTQYLLERLNSKISENENYKEIIIKIMFESYYPILLENMVLSPLYNNYSPEILDNLLKSGKIRIGLPNGISNLNEVGKFNFYLKEYENKFDNLNDLSEILSQLNSPYNQKIETIYNLIIERNRIRLDQIILSTKFQKTEVTLALLFLFTYGFISLGNFIGLRDCKLLTSIPFEHLMARPIGNFGEYIKKINIDLEIGYWEPIKNFNKEIDEEEGKKNKLWLVHTIIDNYGVITVDQINTIIKRNFFTREEFYLAIKRLELENKIIKGTFVKFCRGMQYATHGGLEELRETEIKEKFYFVTANSSYNPWNVSWKIRDDNNNIFQINSSYFNIFSVNKGKIYAHIQFTRSLKFCEIVILRKVSFDILREFIDQLIRFINNNSHSKQQKEFRISKWNQKPILEHPIHNYFEFIGFYIINDYLHIPQSELGETLFLNERKIPEELKIFLDSQHSME